MTNCNKTCRTCAHWGVYAGDRFNLERTYREPCEALTADSSPIEVNIDQGRGWDAGGASVENIETAPDFGCNRWELFIGD